MLSVKELVIEICLSRKKEKKERPLTFISSPLSSFIFVQVHFPVHSPKDSSRISHVSRIRLPRNALNRFFVFCSRFHESRESRYWSTTMIFFIHTKRKNLLESSFESMHICWSTERKILVARFEDHNIRRVAIPIKFSSLPKRHRSKSMARATIGIVGVKALCSCEFRNRRDYWARSGEPEGGRCRVKGLYVSLRKKNVDPLGPGQARPATVIHD